MNDPEIVSRRQSSIVNLRRFLAKLRWSDVLPACAAPGGGRADAAKAAEFALVLTARGIPNRLRTGLFGARLYVRNDRSELAVSEIRAYIAENAGHAPQLPSQRPRFDNARVTLSALIGLAAFFSLTGADFCLSGVCLDWLKSGGGDSRAILSGQWWRLATALTLHGDAAHMAGNLVLGGAFLIPLCREVGVGPGFALALSSGIAGNLLKVAVQGPGQLFIGASTAVFGAVGALGAILAARDPASVGVRRLAPAGAALMFLAFLGSGSEEMRGIDLAGHFCGFAAGVLLGLAFAAFLPRAERPRERLQKTCAIFACLIPSLAWFFALTAG